MLPVEGGDAVPAPPAGLSEVPPEVLPDVLTEVLPEASPKVLPGVLVELFPEVLVELFPEEPPTGGLFGGLSVEPEDCVHPLQSGCT